MIGTPVACTLWEVQYRHLRIEPPSRLIKLGLEEEGPPKPVEGKCFVLTADPTGADLCNVTERNVLGAKATPAHEFRLEHVHRIGDTRGLALVERRED